MSLSIRNEGLLLSLAVVLSLALLCPLPARAAWMDDVGYTQLVAELGSAVPDGTGVEVAQVEATVQNNGTDVWMPDPDNYQFSGKTITDMSGIHSEEYYSGHATGVGRYFYGNTSSMAPGITSIDSYSASDWLGSGFLYAGYYRQPTSSSSRVTNHSWVGSTGDDDTDSNILRRLDWVIDRDEAIQVVAMNNGSNNRALLGSSYNAIAVGCSDGDHAQGSVALDATYTSGRTRPDVVVPLSYTSYSTPVVSSAAALLVDLGHNDTSLSTDPVTTSTTNREGDTIYNAERSEVVKAAIMAGADRVTDNTTSGTDITDYRAAAYQTDNGLDSRYGAGQLNVYNSYQIIAAGEQNSAEDLPAGQGDISWYGFDYDPSFGGANGSNTEGSYYFSADADHSTLYASLVWNIEIDGGTLNDFDGTATLYDLDLFLYDITDSENPFLTAYSTSEVDNTENLWLDLIVGNDYLLQVGVGDGQSSFNWDYALAWQITTAPVPLPSTLILLGSGITAAFLGGMRKKWRFRGVACRAS